ncbi:MAG: TlpA family protein disulfide reductase [Myxococcales bacterium]|nr:TlpA family protein disulfide reductase [Myxococcales bacterium]
MLGGLRPAITSRSALAGALALAATLTVTLGPLACAGALPWSLPGAIYGETIPAFRRQALDGREVSSTALRGDVVVVEFFASYCEPCRHSLPALQRLAERERGLQIIAIGEDEARDKSAAMAVEFGLTMPVVHDVGNLLAAGFRVDGLPTTFVVDRQGVVRWIGGADPSGRELARVVKAVRRGG